MTQNQLKYWEIEESKRANRAREEYEAELKHQQSLESVAQTHLLGAQSKTEKLRPFQVAADTWDKATHGVKNLSDSVTNIAKIGASMA